MHKLVLSMICMLGVLLQASTIEAAPYKAYFIVGTQRPTTLYHLTVPVAEPVKVSVPDTKTTVTTPVYTVPVYTAPIYTAPIYTMPLYTPSYIQPPVIQYNYTQTYPRPVFMGGVIGCFSGGT